ncbi:hypothetical protein [Microvirga sp. Mcv34]|nr:hypothetical protein [Microvirga sp. Mcv34]
MSQEKQSTPGPSLHAVKEHVKAMLRKLPRPGPRRQEHQYADAA